jgi:allantoate deiminase
MSHLSLLGLKTSERLDELAQITDEPGLLYRSFLSPAMATANARVGEWLKGLGCTVNVDGWGNLIGHLPGASSEKVLILGSHLDTVRNAGKYDGTLGVLVAIAALENLAAEGVRLPFSVEVVGWSDEEGARFQQAYLGSRAYSGGFITKADLAAKDAHGKTLAEAVAEHQGVLVSALPVPTARYKADQLLGYVEVHIEQGPVLETENLALGVVEFIAAQTRCKVTLEGKAGHAGTTPMRLRKDALTGAAECILLVEEVARTTPGLVATVGQLQVAPGLSNVIVGRATFSLDIRHPKSEVVRDGLSQLAEMFQGSATNRKLKLDIQLVQQTKSVACSKVLMEKLTNAVLKNQPSVPRMVSGAGHDAVPLSRLTGTAMLFVRSKDGLSHHPDEFTSVEDIGASIEALTTFLREFSL